MYARLLSQVHSVAGYKFYDLGEDNFSQNSVSSQMRSDLQIWLQFLQEYNGATVITDNERICNEKLQLYIDSAAWSKRVYGVYFSGR